VLRLPSSRIVLSAVCVGVTLGALATSGCGKRKSATEAASPLLHASTSHEDRVDVARAARDPDALRRALTRPHRAASLGAHRLEASSKLRVTEAGAEVESLDVTEALEESADGAFHVLSHNSRDYGREAFFVPGAQGAADADKAGRLWIRPGFGKFHHRAPAEPDEPARLLDETFASFGAHFDVVAGAAAVTDAVATTVAGRPAHKITLALGPARPHREAAPERAWREGVTVQALAGEVSLDDATGLPLAGQLTAKVTFVREGHSYELALEATHAVKDIGAAVAIAPPAAADSVETPERSHDFEDREELLHGIAPPAKRGPQAPAKKDDAAGAGAAEGSGKAK
jgi:hypothetical protein